MGLFAVRLSSSEAAESHDTKNSANYSISLMFLESVISISFSGALNYSPFILKMHSYDSPGSSLMT
jgi:hypothetical protein